MKTKIHDNYRRTIDPRNGFETRAEFIGLVGCKACKKRCKGCHWPFTASTAVDEDNYCSAGCEDIYISRL